MSNALAWLFLDLNSYFASVEQQLHPELRDKPVAVVPVMTDATCAIAASYEAKAYGIKTGTMIFEAKQRCPDLICVPARHEHYVAYHHRILEVIERSIPITQVCSIDEVACELGDRWSDEVAALALADEIKHAIFQHIGPYIRCSIGLSTNRFLAKVATNLQKPDGLVTLRADQVVTRCGRRDVDFLPGIGRQRQRKLARAGIETVAQLWELSPKHMRALWHSVEGERFWYKLHGVELASDPTKRSTVGHSHVLAPDYRPEAEACRVGNRLLMKASSRLRRLGFYCRAMAVSVRVEHGPRLSAKTQFYRASDHLTLQRQFQDLWSQVVKQTGRRSPRFKKVAVTLFDLLPASQLQPELFEDGGEQQQKGEHLSHVMDKLNQRYGKDTVTFAHFLGKPSQFTGTKVAFNRIPEREEFEE